MLAEAIEALFGAIAEAAQSSDEAEREQARRLVSSLRARLAKLPDYEAELDEDLAERMKRG